jgi:hypothetical protein
MAVAGLGVADQVGDGGSDIGTSRHREAAALAEVVLNVDDDQGAVHGGCPSVGWRRSGRKGRTSGTRPPAHRTSGEQNY